MPCSMVFFFNELTIQWAVFSPLHCLQGRICGQLRLAIVLRTQAHDVTQGQKETSTVAAREKSFFFTVCPLTMLYDQAGLKLE
jgi:hypothetical protein